MTEKAPRSGAEDARIPSSPSADGLSAEEPEAPGTAAYRRAGVDVRRGYAAVERIRALAARTHDGRVLSGIGGFAALYRLPAGGEAEPVLVAAADGAGTKALLAARTGRHEGIGVDVVAMNVNDIVAQGGRPLFFLDYIAMGRIVPETVEALVRGMADGCREAGCALVGGETAEMPDVYAEGTYDVAGFAVGVLEDGVRKRRPVAAGDILVGLPSTGIHANGFSLVRRILEAHRPNLEAPFEGGTLLEALLRPTAIYVPWLKEAGRDPAVKAMAHITGGGFYENVPRVLPPGLRAVVRFGTWPVPEVFHWLRAHPLPGSPPMAWPEMAGVFNIGLGMIVIVAPEGVDRVQAAIARAGGRAFVVGEVVSGERCVAFVP
ncbi:phosphoribosylformylglycinamidine cyclo-ligase [Hydrogenibacillus sp. N12]|uniref:phosphoribosylformylglycinamidine cyclo-ligase n=1 Tax=Hydrogenibacillus sp. N12 TaxID=2866627 RepID=UPI001C7D4E59|nr:phosphoribosylformylglycinamidine cyclo-ligase [Hydrogenibacillus sp. N12]QZA33293.1 phosphoribosylformylglycinamidine cyclo-ligase [Hydrogenibacillus sp. N12]